MSGAVPGDPKIDLRVREACALIQQHMYEGDLLKNLDKGTMMRCYQTAMSVLEHYPDKMNTLNSQGPGSMLSKANNKLIKIEGILNES